MKISKYILVFSVVIVAVVSCSLKKVSNTLTSKNVYENFYVGDNGNQWYLYPIKFKNKTTHFLLDYTLRDKAKDTVVVKYSIITKEQLSKPKSIVFNLLGGVKYNFDTGKKIYVETNDDVLHLRYTSIMNYEDFKIFFKSIESISIDGITDPVVPTKATIKKFGEINRQVISIIDNY